MKLYEYAVFKDEKRDKEDNVVDEGQVLVKPTTVLANNEKQVGIMAAREITDDHMGAIDRIQVVVRPF